MNNLEGALYFSIGPNFAEIKLNPFQRAACSGIISSYRLRDFQSKKVEEFFLDSNFCEKKYWWEMREDLSKVCEEHGNVGDGFCSAESGYKDFWCVLCGYSHNFYMG